MQLRKLKGICKATTSKPFKLTKRRRMPSFGKWKSSAKRQRILTRDLRSENPQVAWQFATAMRNRLVHGYFDVDASIVWDTTQNDLSPLKSQIEKILENLS